MSGSGGARIDRTHIAAAFDDSFREQFELHQPDYTFRRLRRGSSVASVSTGWTQLKPQRHGDALDDRGGRWPVGREERSQRSQGGPGSPSPIRARVSRGRSVVKPEAARHPAFFAPFEAELEGTALPPNCSASFAQHTWLNAAQPERGVATRP